MDKWNLIVDVAQCHNCNNCVLAAKDEYVGNEFPGYSASHPKQGRGVIAIDSTYRGSSAMVDVAHRPKLCQHCDNAPCVAKGQGAVSKRPDGIVIFDPVKAKGRKDLVEVCPHGAVIWNEELELPQNWIFDAHLLDQGWNMPRCEQVCPTGAISSVKVSDEKMQALVQELGLEVERAELKPRVYFKNLYRETQVFIGGSLQLERDGLLDCAAQVEVALVKEGQELARTTSDLFGDFRFDGLEPNSGVYCLEISAAPGDAKTVQCDLKAESIVLEPFTL
ncbi:oxidoreductase [Marinobacterium zhoushanense]|uniref:Oxidoreductase n=1 Tax=Marinobacterium zhoushanense TaxID=1679163 RepID=A0ABQ1JXQ1_9GAMM|nr:4Fe-4S dicluster domain-containing protein [Marinobacterium zhoushanense]GGB81369.1 oxidoreductase [Marinobacterium zhoushanense]